MKLVKAKIRRYRSIEELDEFEIEPDVTCLVGKNESGKTATLQALFKSRAIDGTRFDDSLDYPSHRTRELRSDDPIDVSTLTYELEDDDVAAVEAELGPGSLVSRSMTVTTGYKRKGGGTFSFTIDQSAVVRHLRGDMELPASTAAAADNATSVADLVSALEAMEGPTPGSTAVIAKVGSWRLASPDHKAIDILDARRPKFVYFGDYDVMPGKVSIPDLIQKRDDEELSRGEQALLALLRISGVELEDFLNPESHEHLVRSMENASNSISDEVFEYWTQNTNLAVQLNIMGSAESNTASTARGARAPFMQIRVRNTRHNVSVPFDERSRGFVWFFSFLAYFSELEQQAEQPLVLLLDEPGLSLHATAQNDLLRFIDERLASTHQVIFTTHSPFMVDAHKFQRVRTVVDDVKLGTTISADVLRVDGETAFPLHAALGIELTQTLFVGTNVLFVEGASDVIFLNYLSDQLKAVGREGLDERWVIVPGGGITKLPAFLTLFGANKITVAVLTDSSEDNDVTIRKLREAGKLYAAGIVQVGDALGRDEADVEDLFEPKFYVDLVNEAYEGALKGQPLTVEELPAGERLVVRVEQAFAARPVGSGRLNHYSPAGALLRRKATGSRKLPAAVLDRAERLFRKVNQLLA
ncbi:ATP-dependent nuclease [Cellulosimicrobium cellulans]|uniref:ATP-dependent nuclease n=1 Tax=Cellulosimicrobium cellulans TaxID=1710 RepID=UPI00130EEFAB|nr:AAA family ATPase [Cellulosimicrobium cellulans]